MSNFEFVTFLETIEILPKVVFCIYLNFETHYISVVSYLMCKFIMLHACNRIDCYTKCHNGFIVA